MAVDCWNQMVTTTVRGVQIKQCSVHLTDCPGPAKCCGLSETDALRKFRMCRLAHDLPQEDPNVVVQVGERIYDAMAKGDAT